MSEKRKREDDEVEDRHVVNEEEDEIAYATHSKLLADHLVFGGKMVIFHVDTLRLELPDGLLCTRGLILARVEQIVDYMKAGNIETAEMTARCVVVIFQNENLQKASHLQRIKT